MSDGSGTAELKALRAEVAALNRKVDQLTRILRTSPGLRSVPLDDGMILTRLLEGQRLLVDSHDIGMTPTMLITGTWEPQHVQALKALVQPGHVCIDVGANVGFFSVLMSSLVKREGRVFAFEPQPRLFSLLSRSLTINGFAGSGIATAHQVALSDAAGRGVMRVPDRDAGVGSLLAPLDTGIGALEEIEVDLRTLDSYAIDVSRPVFMKLDCEGAEYSVLRGAEATLRRAETLTILMEFAPSLIEQTVPLADFGDYLARLGLSVFRQDGEGASFDAVPMEELPSIGHGYLFLSRGALG
jgi:FkbM family methyltransferase